MTFLNSHMSMKMKSIVFIIVLVFASLQGLAAADNGLLQCKHESSIEHSMEMSSLMDQCDMEIDACNMVLTNCSISISVCDFESRPTQLSPFTSVYLSAETFHVKSFVTPPDLFPPIV